jgi:DNA polymerase-3 subunit gamma/tau
VRAGGGSVRDALSILDQLLAGAGDGGVTYQRAVGLLGVTDGALLDDMVDALAAGDAAAVYGAVDRVVEAGHDPRRFAADLLDRFRDLILLAAVPDAADRGLIDAPEDQTERMADQSIRIGVATLTRYAEIVHTALLEMRGTTSSRLVLELLCARMLLPDASADAAALLQRVERLERRATASGEPALAKPAPIAAEPTQPEPKPAKPKSARPAPTNPAPTRPAPTKPEVTSRPEPAAAEPTAATLPPPAPESPATDEPPAHEPKPAGALDSAALRRLWPEVLDVVKQTSRRTRALLDNAQITGVDGEKVIIAAPAALARMIAEESNTSLLRAALTQVLGGSWQISVEPGGPGGGSSSGATEPSGPTGSDGESERSGGSRPRSGRSPAEPDPRDDTDETAPGLDPEAEALKLLQDQLGARPVD